MPENTQEQIDTFLYALPACLLDACWYSQYADPGQLQTQGLSSYPAQTSWPRNAAPGSWISSVVCHKLRSSRTPSGSEFSRAVSLTLDKIICQRPGTANWRLRLCAEHYLPKERKKTHTNLSEILFSFMQRIKL